MQLNQPSTSLNSPPRWVRRVAAAMLPVLVFCMLGVPIPDFAPKFVNERFPCEKCPCGCRTAAHCWDKCCCFTDQEKLDWAEKNNVAAPKFLVERVAESKKSQPKVGAVLDVASSSKSSAKSTCCGCCEKRTGSSSVAESIKDSNSYNSKECLSAKGNADSKCKNCNSVSAKSCQKSESSLPKCRSCTVDSCANASCDATSCSTIVHDDKSKLEKRTKIILLESALKCQGVKMALLLFKCALTPASCVIQFTTRPVIGALDIFDLVASTIYLDLDGPVPRSF